jgi:hypothetical protein
MTLTRNEFQEMKGTERTIKRSQNLLNKTPAFIWNKAAKNKVNKETAGFHAVAINRKLG